MNCKWWRNLTHGGWIENDDGILHGGWIVNDELRNYNTADELWMITESTKVGDNINIMKTTFDINFYLY